jgi:hypothetical protein
MTTLSKKPLVRAVESDPRYTPHGVKRDLVVTVHPGGLLTIRPKRTRTAPTVSFHLAGLYAKGLGQLF